MAEVYRPGRRDRLRIRQRRATLERMRAVLEPERTRILDLGGGTGATATVFGAGAQEIVVVEPNAKKVARGKAAHAPVTFVDGFAESLPYGPERFDRVVSLMSFHHFADGDAVLREAARVLAPGGRLVVYDFDRSHWLGRWAAFFEGRRGGPPARFVTPAELERRVTAAGFARTRHESVGAGTLLVGER